MPVEQEETFCSNSTHQIPAIVLSCPFLGDNEAVINIIVKGKSPHVRHVSRTHHVNLDWPVATINLSSNTSEKQAHTNQQVADLLTRGSFTHDKLNELASLFVSVSESFHRSPFLVVATLVPLAHQVAKRSRCSIKARHLNQIPKKKNFLAGSSATSEKLTSDLCSRKDAIRCQRPGPQARHQVTECMPR